MVGILSCLIDLIMINFVDISLQVTSDLFCFVLISCFIYCDAVDRGDFQLLLFTERYNELSLATQVLNDAAKKKDSERFCILLY